MVTNFLTGHLILSFFKTKEDQKTPAERHDSVV